MTTPAPPADTSITAPAAAASLVDSEGTLAAHLTAIVTAAVGVIALIHPGFSAPHVVQALIPSVALASAVGIEAVHLVSQRGLKGTLAKAWADVEEAAHYGESTALATAAHPAQVVSAVKSVIDSPSTPA